MTDIKELALRVAETVYGAPVAEYAAEQFIDFAQRFLAAYLAEQEPVAEVYRHGKDSHGREWHGIHWYDPNLDVPAGTKLFTAPPLPEPCEHTRSKWNIQGTHGTCQDCGQELLEPAPVWKDISGRCGGHNGEYDHQCLKCGYITWFASYTDPNKENVACPKCHADPEPVRCCNHDSDCAVHNEPAYPAGPCDCGAAPSSEEVREMVERLKIDAVECWKDASDLIERLAARVPTTAMEEAIAAGDGTLHGAIDYWQERALKAEAARVPDGCVVVPREPTSEMLEAGMYSGLNAPDIGGICSPFTAEAYDTYKAMIAAGEKDISLSSSIRPEIDVRCLRITED